MAKFKSWLDPHALRYLRNRSILLPNKVGGSNLTPCGDKRISSSPRPSITAAILESNVFERRASVCSVLLAAPF